MPHTGTSSVPQSCGRAFMTVTSEAYATIPIEIKAPALSLLAELLEPMAAQIRLDYGKDSVNWWKQGHFHFGLAVRNQLRRKGFAEGYFGVANLDDIYIPLVKEALKLR